MTKYILILMVLLCPHEFPQQYYTFSELKGLNDSLNNTHLFYRLFWSHSVDSLMEYSFENSMYHFDLSTGIDSFFISEFGSGDLISNYAVYLNDLEFWNSDPTKYIYSGSEVGMDPVGFVTRFDDPHEKIYIPSFGEFQIDISKQNDSVIYTGISNLQSVDSGYNWIDKDWDVGFLSLSPFNDQEIFAYGYPGLYKSTNAGNDFQVVDTTRISDLQPEFFYDADENHIYRVFQSYQNYLLSVSDNNGNAFSWTTKYSSLSKIFLSINPAQSGELFLADGKDIYRSVNYGESFDFYRSLDRDVVGIYKEPGSPNLYAATKYKIFMITNDSLIVLKSLAIDPDIFDWFPLEIGNKWVYISYIIDQFGQTYFERFSTMQVVGQSEINGINYTAVFNNCLNYYSFADTLHLRYAQDEGRIYRYDEDSNSEVLFYDFLIELGDTLYVNMPWTNSIILEEIHSAYLFETNTIEWYFRENGPCSCGHTLTKGFGMTNSYFDEFGGQRDFLKGCVINGIVYGDTTVTDVNEKQPIPKEFALYQNYPNPFNPSTIIKYAINSRQFVSLKIFNSLGEEIETLVNEYQEAGVHSKMYIVNSTLSSGVYFYQLKAGSFEETKKMILLR